MKNRTYWMCLIGILVVGLFVRLTSLPPKGFYDDVPLTVLALEQKTGAFGFPGYAPYVTAVDHLAGPNISYFQAMVILSLIAGMGSIVYVMLAARAAGGDLISLGAGATMAFGLFSVYYSVIGTTYVFDMLCVSGMAYHGWEFLRSRRPAHFYYTLAWHCFGLISRPISSGFTFFGLVVLLYLWRNRTAMIVTVVAVAAMLALYVGLSADTKFFGSLNGFIKAGELYPETLHNTSDWRHRATNLFRFFASPIYGEQVWLLFGLVIAAKYWKNRKKWELLFLAGLGVPYLLVIFRYIAHAGYYCLLFPIFALLPLCFLTREKPASAKLIIGVTTTFVLVALAQWYVIRPIEVTNMETAVLDAYVLQHCRVGVRTATCDTLAKLVLQKQLGTDKIPAERLKEVEIIPTPPAAKDIVGWP